MDDTYSRFNDIPSSETFLGILNSQEPRIQFTADYENDEKELNFLDVTVKNTKINKFSFKVYRKDAITNVQIKPSSSVAPNIKDGVIKGFVSRAHAICPQCNLHAEIEFLKSMFVENGYDHVHVNKIVDNYKPGQRRLLEDDNKHCIDHVETWFEYKAKNTFQERWYQGEIQINTKFAIHLMQKEQIVNRPAVNIWCLYDSMFLWKTIRGRDRGNDKNTVETTPKSRV